MLNSIWKLLMSNRTVVITGANGEIGHLLLETLSAAKATIIAVDLTPLSEYHTSLCEEVIVGDICDDEVIRDIEKYDINEIFHLAAISRHQTVFDWPIWCTESTSEYCGCRAF